VANTAPVPTTPEPTAVIPRVSAVDSLLYGITRATISLIRALPLSWVARLGQLGGRIVGLLDARHRRVARHNLERALGDQLDRRQIRRLVSENFGRIGENFACAVRTAGMSPSEIREILEVVGFEKMLPQPQVQPPPSRVVAIGHFGNFELFASAFSFAPGYRFATTYRALRQPAINELMQELREKSGCEFFERRLDGDALRTAMGRGGLLIGLLADQHAGRSGVWAPFFGQKCSTTPAPAVMALRYRCPLFTAVCYRVGLARWRIEVGDEIPTRIEGRRRSVADITADINRAFEAAIRRDPANWFWVHNRWKERRPVSGDAAIPEHDPPP
jgi:lauroyl/myristoyl acyltransferase